MTNRTEVCFLVLAAVGTLYRGSCLVIVAVRLLYHLIWKGVGGTIEAISEIIKKLEEQRQRDQKELPEWDVHSKNQGVVAGEETKNKKSKTL